MGNGEHQMQVRKCRQGLEATWLIEESLLKAG